MIKGEKNILTIFKTRKYLREVADKRYFPYSGIRTYLGMQGAGKTIRRSKVYKRHIREIPRCNIYK